MEHLLKSVWSTHLFNFATHESIYCVFPEATLVDKYMYLLCLPPTSTLRLYGTYLERGYKRRQLRLEPERLELSSARFIGDSLTYRLKFDARVDFIPSVLTEVKFELSSFGVSILMND